MCAFSTSLTTTVFSQRSMWRFETVPHRTIPEGPAIQQSSIFHRALIPPSDCLPTTRFLIRGALEATSEPGYSKDLGRVWRVPIYWPGGVRHRGGVNLACVRLSQETWEGECGHGSRCEFGGARGSAPGGRNREELS